MILLLALLLAADPKPPECLAATTGVIWNYGTASTPNYRRCDGISYVPVQLCAVVLAPAAAPIAAAAPPPAPAPATPAPVAAATTSREACEKACSVTSKSCVDGCPSMDLSDIAFVNPARICKENCGDELAACGVACSKQFPRKQPSAASRKP